MFTLLEIYFCVIFFSEFGISNIYIFYIAGVDEIVAVMAGSMLWMDCSSLASVTDNLLMVSYRKNKDMFYSQINNPTLTAIGRIGFPTNNTIGRSLGGRLVFSCTIIWSICIFGIAK